MITPPAYDDAIEVTVCGVHRDEGSVVVFWGQTNDGLANEVLFAVDHRHAQVLADCLEAADYDVVAVIEPYQIVSLRSA